MNGDPVIEQVASIGSTNAGIIARLATPQPPGEGHWLVAERQTDGRGRLGRSWQDGAGNFMGSTVVHLRPGDPPPPTLALVAALAVYDSVAEAMADPRTLSLKWPNDILLNGAKLGGILLERNGDVVVIGVGINLAQAPDLPDRRSAALSDTGVVVSPADFATRLAQTASAMLTLWRGHNGLREVIARWQQRGPVRGTAMRVTLSDHDAIDGGFAGLDDDGALLIDLEDGTRRAIHAGEVSLLGGEAGE